MFGCHAIIIHRVLAPARATRSRTFAESAGLRGGHSADMGTGRGQSKLAETSRCLATQLSVVQDLWVKRRTRTWPCNSARRDADL